MHLLFAGDFIGELPVISARRIGAGSSVFIRSSIPQLIFFIDGLVTLQCYAIGIFLLRLLGFLSRNMDVDFMKMFFNMVLPYDVLT